jgi:hypothetical protein
LINGRSSPAAAWEYVIFEPHHIQLIKLHGTIPFTGHVNPPPPAHPVTWAAPTSARRLEVRRGSSILLRFSGNDVMERGESKVLINVRGEQLREGRLGESSIIGFRVFLPAFQSDK